MAARKKARKSATKSSARKRTVSRKSAPAPAMAMSSSCGSDEKWVGLGLFFVGALILLNTWRGWVSWSVLVGAVLAVYGLYHYFRYG